MRAAHAPSDIALLDRHGTPIQMLRVNTEQRRGPWLALADVSPALRHALLLSEDRRFFEHGGVDWRALAASAWANAWNQRTRGASTLTMQLAGLLDEDVARPAGGRSVVGKVSQIVRARELENRWSKAQILEAYLNQVPLRGELVGVAAASQQLFGKHASGLDTIEAALLAVMVRAPNAGTAALERRACELLRQQAQGCEGLATTLAQALARRPGPAAGESLAPHMARLLARDAGTAPKALHSTLDATLQRVALSALRRQLAELRGHNVEDGAVLVLDNASGEVLAWVGSSGAGSSASEVDAVLARRQPGSTLKPLIYALALQQRLITPASLLDDSALQIAAGGALYQPQNYDHRYRGAVSARTALASSLNVPAVRVGAMLGPDAMFEGLNRAGLRLSQNAGYHGHALALGSADVTLARPRQRLPHAGAPGAAGAGALVGRHARRSRATDIRRRGPTAGVQPRRGLAGGRHAVRRRRARHHLWSRQPAGHARLGGGENRHQQGHARQLVRGLQPAATRWRCGWATPAAQAMHGVSGVSGAAPVWRELMAHAARAETVAGAAAAPWTGANTKASGLSPAPNRAS